MYLIRRGFTYQSSTMAKFYIFSLLLLTACHASKPTRVLIFSKTSVYGYRHESIEAGKQAMVEICQQHGILADTTENSLLLTEENLKNYQAVVFLNTNGEVLGPDQEADFERYIQAGGGFMGVHAASATEYTWKWYGGLVGAYFKDHPVIQTTPLQVASCDDPSTVHLGCKDWEWKDEWYNFRQYEPDLEVLLTIDEKNYKGGAIPPGTHTADKHPLAWRHTYDGGRAFYTAIGHLPEAYANENYRKHLWGGLQYALGNKPSLNYKRCRTARRPDNSRFVKTTLTDHLNEPMELDQFPDGKILFIERHGYIKLFDPQSGLAATVTKLPVYSEMGDGLLGLAIDPNWSQNRRIFLYYSALKDSVNQLSQFIFQGDTLDKTSEKVILKIPVGRFNCFHAAGSLAFGPDGLLYLATGDNTSPFASDGFAPIDDRPGRMAFDARRSAGNTMDLRGKILRIRVDPEGNYTCPDDNLFAKNKEGRPEIFVMGCRNPFRIAIDQRRNWLYWGDIGPDAGKSDTTRGPLGHDEINQARKAGNFGWPLFVGNNQNYREYNFETKVPGMPFDPAAPVNNSIYNTGAKTLPPAQNAYIWYPYSRNRDFPMLGDGGRNAMAGPTYYTDLYPEKTRFPDYYNGKTIVYDWMRNWLMAVTPDSLGNFYHIEPIADSVKLTRPMDMLVDRRTGSIWLLEYGRQWYSSNEEACLSRIDYVRGNRKPKAVLAMEKPADIEGATLWFSGKKSKDPDGDALQLSVQWGAGDWEKWPTKDTVTHQFAGAGIYDVVLKAVDPEGLESRDTQRICIGNARPEIQIVSSQNRSFYEPGQDFNYKIVVKDREDCANAAVFCRNDYIQSSVDYFEKGLNPSRLPEKKADESVKYARGKALIAASDCYTCHAVDKTINGPAFAAVAERYKTDRDFSVKTIYRKIIYGGSGNWGQRAMSAHPTIREEDAIEMAKWILALGDPAKPVQHLPVEGKWTFDAVTGAYLVQASYTDLGKGTIPALSASTALVMRPSQLEAENADARSKGLSVFKDELNKSSGLEGLKNGAWICIKNIDFQGITGVNLHLSGGLNAHPYLGGRAELRLNGVDGPILGSAEIPARNGEKRDYFEQFIPISLGAGGPDWGSLYILFRNEHNKENSVVGIDWLRVALR